MEKVLERIGQDLIGLAEPEILLLLLFFSLLIMLVMFAINHITFKRVLVYITFMVMIGIATTTVSVLHYYMINRIPLMYIVVDPITLFEVPPSVVVPAGATLFALSLAMVFGYTVNYASLDFRIDASHGAVEWLRAFADRVEKWNNNLETQRLDLQSASKKSNKKSLRDLLETIAAKDTEMLRGEEEKS